MQDRNATDNKPLSGLLGDAFDQFSRLIRSEIALARAELVDKASDVARNSIMIVAGGLLVPPSIGVLLIALAAWLIEAGVRSSVSYLIAGVIGLVVQVLLPGWA